MRILVVHGRQINEFPPVRNLIRILVRQGHEVSVITRDKSGFVFPEIESINYNVLPEAKRKVDYFSKRKEMRKLVSQLMKKNDVLWTTTDSTVRDLGKIVYKYRHIMQLMELIEDIPVLPGINFIGLNIKKYAQKAAGIVVPEVNRAYILKAWWDLKRTPFVLPNKMDLETIATIPEEVSRIISEIKSEPRKIILYQGVFTPDRNLDSYAEAIDALGKEYCLYLMGSDADYRKDLCERYNNIKYIPFIRPPYHLLITRYAHIGLLPYVAKKSTHCSVLNALYCAPNKIFEYAACGLPMIGSDVLGLRYPFEKFNIGYVCETQSKNEIIELIRKIDHNYVMMKENCQSFYESVNMDEIVENILNESVHREVSNLHHL